MREADPWRYLDAGELPLAGPFRVLTDSSSFRVDTWDAVSALLERYSTDRPRVQVPVEGVRM